MSKKDREKQPAPQTAEVHAEADVVETVAPDDVVPETPDFSAELSSLKAALSEKEDQYLRLAAEYDNFRKRSQKEKESIYGDAKSDTVLALLPVYDNLERALKQDTCDEAYAKGVEMTMTGLKECLAQLGVTEIPAQDQPFDPLVHNAVMHVEQEEVGENIITEVFQSGFQLGEKVIRFAMVKVAN